ncbi:MAG: FAD-dependent oxidoreductase [Candidatus Caldarchaeum sp.]
MYPVKEFSTDVLVIGGGAAGCTAALKSKELGCDILLICKSLIGRGGCSPTAGLIRAPLTLPNPLLLKIGTGLLSIARRAHVNGVKYLPSGYKKAIYSTIKYYMHYLVEQDYPIDAMTWILREFYPAYEQKGLYVRRDDNGIPVTNTDLERAVGYMFVYKYGFNGAAFMDLKRKEVLAAGIRVLEETAAVDLLINDGTCVGALAINYQKGHLYVIKAKSTILATGHTNWLAVRSSATREQSANGFGMAYRAGCEFQNMEIQWWHASDTAVGPTLWAKLHNYPNALPGTRDRMNLINSEGQKFYDSSMHPLATAPYFNQLKALYKQVVEGKARWDGGYYASYTHIPQHTMKEYFYHTEFYEKLGLDPSKDYIECGITWHMTLGGVKNNIKTMETNIPGLFVAGSVGGHYLGGIPFVCYDGVVAATNAAKRAKSVQHMDVDEQQVKDWLEKVRELTKGKNFNGLAPLQIKQRIRQVMWNYMGFVKSQTTMKSGIEALRQVEEELVPKMYVQSNGAFNFDLIEAFDVEDMLVASKLAIVASLVRTESRGPFFREDYPKTDNRNWVKFVVVGKGSDGPAFKRLEPIELKYVKPETDMEDYFTTDY